MLFRSDAAARALERILPLAEGLEDDRKDVRGDPDAGIGDRDLHSAVAGSRLDDDATRDADDGDEIDGPEVDDLDGEMDGGLDDPDAIGGDEGDGVSEDGAAPRLLLQIFSKTVVGPIFRPLCSQIRFAWTR